MALPAVEIILHGGLKKKKRLLPIPSGLKGIGGIFISGSPT
jgi:hypothetical protein